MIAQRAARRRAGFTLLELLISAALTATLLVMVWSLFGIYTKLNDRGVEQATELQLARALMQQFRADLQIVIPPLPRRLPASGSPPSPAPIAAPQAADIAKLPDGPDLVGTSTSLTFLVRSTREPPAARTDSLRESEPPLPVLYDRVSYRWRKMTMDQSIGGVAMDAADMDRSSRASIRNTGDEERSDELDSSGLTRRVIPWNSSNPSEVPLARMREDADRASRFEQIEQASAPAEPVDAVPEVSRLTFRYFDGQRWRGAWNSRSQQRLPAAIEVTFELEDPERQQRRLLDPANAVNDRIEVDASASEGETEPVAESQGPIADVGPAAFDRESSLEYRIVIAVDPGAKPAVRSKASVP